MSCVLIGPNFVTVKRNPDFPFMEAKQTPKRKTQKTAEDGRVSLADCRQETTGRDGSRKARRSGRKEANAVAAWTSTLNPKGRKGV